MVATRRRPGWLLAIVSGIAAVVLVVAASPASGHEDEKATKASLLVRQAIALIVNTPDDTMAIEDKINDAVESDDPEGVDIARVSQAKDALEAGDLHRVRALLEVSIGAQPHLTSALPLDIRETPGTPGAETAGLELATGDDPGGNLANDPLTARRHFDGRTTTVFVLSLLAVALGTWLAVRFRPIRTSRLHEQVVS